MDHVSYLAYLLGLFESSLTIIAPPMQNTRLENIIAFLRPNFSPIGKMRRDPKKHPAWKVDTIFP